MNKKNKTKKLASGDVITAIKHGTTQSEKSFPRDEERAKKIMNNMISGNAAAKFGEFLKKSAASNPTVLQQLLEASSVEAAQNVDSDKKESRSKSKGKELRKGGPVRGHGCELRGKTKGRFV